MVARLLRPRFKTFPITFPHCPLFPQPDPIAHQFALVTFLDQEKLVNIEQAGTEAVALFSLAEQPREFIHLARI